MNAAAELDVLIVLFRVRWEEFATVLDRLGRRSTEFRTLRVLLSGSVDDRRRLQGLLESSGLHRRAKVSHRFDNFGFAGGHNRLLADAFRDGARWCLVLNPDVLVEKGAISALLRSATGTGEIAFFGPSLSAERERTKVVDSLGIAWTAEGRHVDRGQGEGWAISPGRVTRQAGLTGACLLVSAAAFHRLTSHSGHFFDDYFLAYREDAELGIRAASLGVPSMLVEMDGFSHQRAVAGSQRGHGLADLLGVRNRFLLRWKLGRLRPGVRGLPTLRDLVVATATLSIERASLPGLTEAFRIRRAMIGRQRRFGAGSADGQPLENSEVAGADRVP
jgi:GT2 family glycosyltransferase